MNWDSEPIFTLLDCGDLQLAKLDICDFLTNDQLLDAGRPNASYSKRQQLPETIAIPGLVPV